MSFFTITPAEGYLTLDEQKRTATITFSAQNKSGNERQLRALPIPDSESEASWYTVRDPVQTARVDETVQFVVEVRAPDAEPGSYGFQLRVVAADDPDDVYSDSQRLPVEIPERPEVPVTTGTPWWLWSIGAGAAIATVVVFVFVVTNGDGDGQPVRTPVVTTPETPTPDPEPPEDDLFAGEASESLNLDMCDAFILLETTSFPTGEIVAIHMRNTDVTPHRFIIEEIDADVEARDGATVVARTPDLTVEVAAGRSGPVRLRVHEAGTYTFSCAPLGFPEATLSGQLRVER